jgi:hypothetical protein
LREANATVRIKVAGFNLIYRGLHQSAEFFALRFGNGRLQILDLRMVFPDEDYESYFGNSGKLGITDQLRIERKQACGIIRIPGSSCFPIDDAAQAIEFTNGIHVGQEVISSRELVHNF